MNLAAQRPPHTDAPADRPPAQASTGGIELSPALVVRLYHRRTKHRFQAYAVGPGVLDWDAQPAAFRHYEGASAVALPLIDELDADAPLRQALVSPFASLPLPPPAQPVGLASLGALFQLSLGVTAWKTLGPDRWAVRANPSSGNLHPVEAWIVSHAVPGLADGVHHYRPEDHALECRASDRAAAPGSAPRLQIALSSAMWREAWKYGERAFRYCQLDVGHAVGALRYACAMLGWRMLEQRQIGTASLAGRLGLDRSADFPARKYPETELEEAEILFTLEPLDAPASPALLPAALRADTAAAQWHGTASMLDPRPMFRWPIIGEVAVATRRADDDAPRQSRLQSVPCSRPVATPGGERGGAELVLGRRSAQRFTPEYVMPRSHFASLLRALEPRAGLPWDALQEHRRITPVLFIHRVEGMEPGLYVYSRDSAAAAPLLARLQQPFSPRRVDKLGEDIDLRFLQGFEPVQLHRLARSLHCHQDIASTACLALGMIAPFDGVIAEDAAAYRDLYREAGLLGQVLYLQAEALGLRGTGIGCFFDDPVHELLGLDGEVFQTLYHFTIGKAVDDRRIESTPAYAKRPTPGSAG
ncbi:oxidoreductase [Azoarcus sp. DD4]|uniref:nitroreductase family protein n=1 Tax=Azoarcus sp. DD4 TaxID=2027405 RepID=UPI00112BAAF5|nr:nitroreductase family protein [Azoarcus sp. DD4]QDF97655.1 oxidoreductase [Azoarcus sp. DD4]